MVFNLFGGFKVMNEIADEIGIERRIFKTSLTEARVNFAHFKNMKKVLILGELSEQEAIKELAPMCYDASMRGMQILDSKFPQTPDIERAIASLIRYYERIEDNGELDKFQNNLKDNKEL